MKYRRKSDGVIVDAEFMPYWTGDFYRIKDPDNTANCIFFYDIPRKKFEPEYEEIKEEKPMFIESTVATCMKCGQVQTYLHGQEVPICRTTAGCDGGLTRKAPPPLDYKKPMHNFKVGDRVAVYTMQNDRRIGAIKHINNTHIINFMVVFDNQKEYEWGNFHPKQCRKLKKAEPMRFWGRRSVIEVGTTLFNMQVSTVKPETGEWFEFVEVRK